MSDAVRLDQVTKTYGSTMALADVSLAFETGAVHALLGENGAGKSTLVKILSGLARPDRGTVSLFDQQVVLADRSHSSALGIETAFQEIPLVSDLSVADNLLVPNQPRRFGLLLDHKAARDRVAAIGGEFEIEDIDPRALVRELDLSQRQKVEITRAVARKPRLLILDEPTAALSKADVEWLGRRIQTLKAAGTTVILVTHRMPEVHEFCSRMAILRNGRHVGSFAVGEISDEAVFKHIMGRSVEVTFPVRTSSPSSTEPLLSARNLRAGRQLESVTLEVRPGEIVGVAALQGMGQLELFNALFGAERVRSGTILVDGRPAHFAGPADAIDAGIGYVPEDRKIQGLALHRSGAENASIPIVADLSRLGVVDTATENVRVDAAFAAVNLHPRALYQTAAEFSGGNQQKMVLAKWLLTHCRILLAFDPTRGVDVGTKHEIYGILRRFAEAGGAVLLHSTEVPELIGLCDHIAVLYRGRVVADLADHDATEETVGAWMLGAGQHKQAFA
jgi:ribose transport system ATP-binding protein